MAVMSIEPKSFQLLNIKEHDYRISHLIISLLKQANVSKKMPEINTPHNPSQSTAFETRTLYFFVIFYSVININANISCENIIKALPSKGLA